MKTFNSPFFTPSSHIEKTRHWLPHWQQGAVWQFVTWRLADSLPAHLLSLWKSERETWLRLHPPPWNEQIEEEYHRSFSDRIEQWLDAGYGACHLRAPENAKVVAEALEYFNMQRYELASYVVMPNHVHVLFRPLPPHSLHALLHSWKSYTAKRINQLIGRKGSLWQHEYFDRMIRSSIHFQCTKQYILDNPQKAKLKPGEFRFASFAVSVIDEYGRQEC